MSTINKNNDKIDYTDFQLGFLLDKKTHATASDIYDELMNNNLIPDKLGLYPDENGFYTDKYGFYKIKNNSKIYYKYF
jgi:hypothetical protein